jgi:apoptosis-inducing factor 2
VQGPDALLNSAYPLSYRERVKRAAIAREIEVLTNEYVDVIPEGDFVADGVNTRSGKHINADLVISTRGIRPATEFLASSGVPLTTTGYVKAKGTLQVEGFTNVFVAGDALDFDEQKQSAKVNTTICAGTTPTHHLLPSMVVTRQLWSLTYLRYWRERNQKQNTQSSLRSC